MGFVQFFSGPLTVFCRFSVGFWQGSMSSLQAFYVPWVQFRGFSSRFVEVFGGFGGVQWLCGF